MNYRVNCTQSIKDKIDRQTHGHKAHTLTHLQLDVTTTNAQHNFYFGPNTISNIINNNMATAKLAKLKWRICSVLTVNIEIEIIIKQERELETVSFCRNNKKATATTYKQRTNDINTHSTYSTKQTAHTHTLYKISSMQKVKEHIYFGMAWHAWSIFSQYPQCFYPANTIQCVYTNQLTATV